MNPELKDLIQQLLKRDPNRRLNENNIRHHELFRDIKWTEVEACRLHPPNHPCQISLEEKATCNKTLPPEETNQPGISYTDQIFFTGFSYTSPTWRTPSKGQ
ncbi:ribosomal protein S6 kinase beta-2-like [Hyla sarda]|uniref:ribosomal protein S6 kinase beta-2-like n=1 Tax=Hyla sarda TaxID=327740 RepID=UPI0024C362A9|nr:ribosomal protein S6 kinase beta-2-like [Hyla sarda]